MEKSPVTTRRNAQDELDAGYPEACIIANSAGRALVRVALTMIFFAMIILVLIASARIAGSKNPSS